jgi:hypothetical protein
MRSANRRTERIARSAIAAFAACLLGAARPAAAAPQLSTTVVVGAAGNGDRSHLWSSTDFAGGLRGELLFGRSRDADFGVGPYVETLTTTGFSNLQIGAGATLLVPVHPYLPVTLSAGGYLGHDSTFGWQPGLAAELFWGSHGFNYDSFYALSGGIFGGLRYGVGDLHDVSVLVGARIDLEVVALPFILVYNAIRGGDPAR